MKRWIVRGGLAVLAMLLLGGAAQGASFDCKKAASRVEQTICHDPDLDSYDSQIEGAYQGALDRSNDPDKLREQQRAWTRDRDACADAKCMMAAYVARIALLSKLSDPPALCTNGGSTPEVNACQAAYSKRADRELDRYVAAARKRIGEDVVETSGAEAKGTLASFDKAQAAWVAYRKAECSAVYDNWSDGTIRGAMFEDCWQSVTKARTLAVWETWLGFMDDTPPLAPRPEADEPK